MQQTKQDLRVEHFFYIGFNPILHTAWLDNHALTLKSNTIKYCFGEKSCCLHTFQKIFRETRIIEVKFKNSILSVYKCLKKSNLNVWQNCQNFIHPPTPGSPPPLCMAAQPSPI